MSARFLVLIGILGVVTAATVVSAAGGIRSVASTPMGIPALFLKLFTVRQTRSRSRLFVFIGFLGPLLGIMFGFDAISGERSQGTLPRLLAQPIHRDEVIIGKFVGGLTIIAMMLTALTLFVSGIGIFRLGLSPTAGEIGRLFVWLIVSIIYVGFWQALATLHFDAGPAWQRRSWRRWVSGWCSSSSALSSFPALPICWRRRR